HSLRVVFDGARKASLQFAGNGAVPAAFPRERWSVTPHPTDLAVIHNASRGLVVQTPRRAYGFALESPPLTVPADGRYRFALRYRHISGQLAFGARPADDSKYLAADAVGHPIAGEREMGFWVDLRHGESVLL